MCLLDNPVKSTVLNAFPFCSQHTEMCQFDISVANRQPVNRKTTKSVLDQAVSLSTGSRLIQHFMHTGMLPLTLIVYSNTNNTNCLY